MKIRLWVYLKHTTYTCDNTRCCGIYDFLLYLRLPFWGQYFLSLLSSTTGNLIFVTKPFSSSVTYGGGLYFIICIYTQYVKCCLFITLNVIELHQFLKTWSITVPDYSVLTEICQARTDNMAPRICETVTRNRGTTAT